MNVAYTLARPAQLRPGFAEADGGFADFADRLQEGLAAGRRTLQILNGAKQALAALPAGWLAARLAGLRADEAELAALARRSVFNKNGFYKIRLAERPGFSLRLHIWLPGVHAQENLHSHRWPLVSRVLNGALVSEYWEDALSGDAEVYSEYHYRDAQQPLVPAGPARVRLETTAAYRQGDAYFLPADRLHRVAADPVLGCSTLMLRFANTRAWSRNLMRAGADLDVSPAPCSAADLARALDWLSAEMAGQG
ncbi:hypothetical protein KUW17_08915 [Leisingera aquaemixtae]|uniref:hypothetical protein n=1 Tax=Leisingera aquaemixtae TaxID=1396826 RepID=UPI001C94454C|nr:hypothetical protein [Leisingera aquaemixtae]MBY6066860.1 hypothetical protein [Leisingera aquaemixtae]